MGPLDYKILVLDDEPSVASITATTLKTELGGTVDVCNDPEAALTMMREAPPAVLVSDFRMPGMTGVEVMKEVQKFSPNTVCVLVTAFTSKELLMEILNEGCVWKCLEKPWRSDALSAMVGEALALYHERQSVSQAPAAPSSSPSSKVQKKKTPAAAPASGRPKVIIKKGAGGSGGMRSGKSAALRRKLGKGGNVRIRGKSKPGERSEEKSEAIADQRYKDLVPIGEGGSGVIYRATDNLLGMPVAIKVLAKHIALDPEAIKRLFAEARLAMHLSHKHIVRLHNIESLGDSYYLVMEFIDGITLRDMLNGDDVIPVATVVQIADICEDAFGYAHRREIYHRDIKPDNFMVTRDGVLKIIDFGLACLAQRPSDDNIRGTPYYVSPEEIRGNPIDQRSDVFSLAIMVHEMLTGKLPFGKGKEDVDMRDFVPVPSYELSLGQQLFFKKAFASDPDKRHPDIHVFTTALHSALGVPAG